MTPPATPPRRCRQDLAAALALAAADVAAAPASQPAALLAATAQAIETLRQLVDHARGDLDEATSFPPPHHTADVATARVRAREASDRLGEARALTQAAAEHAATNRT